MRREGVLGKAGLLLFPIWLGELPEDIEEVKAVGVVAGEGEQFCAEGVNFEEAHWAGLEQNSDWDVEGKGQALDAADVEFLAGFHAADVAPAEARSSGELGLAEAEFLAGDAQVECYASADFRHGSLDGVPEQTASVFACAGAGRAFHDQR